MNYLEITPKTLNARAKTVLVSLTAIFLGFALAYFPDIVAGRRTGLEDFAPVEDLLLLFAIWFVILVVFGSIAFAALWKKIRIEGNLVHFMSKGITSGWQTVFLLDLERITSIEGKSHTVRAGKHSVQYYWLIFSFEDGSNRDFEVSQWAPNVITGLHTHIRQYYPDIILNTTYMKDSLEKISGLDQYMK